VLDAEIVKVIPPNAAHNSGKAATAHKSNSIAPS
jgi:hypothetical protein